MIIAALIGGLIIRSAFGIFKEANLELMDGSADSSAYAVIVDAVNAVDGAANPHRAKMRKVAGLWDIDFDIDVDPECTVTHAHHIASLVEREVKLRLDNVLDIMIHVEPMGGHHEAGDESFGLTESMMRRE
jgi:divalent metal cation (Fe/Co/Zn/Cd) transporter